MPEGHDGQEKVGAIFFMHGYRGSAKGTMKNKNIAKAVSDLGLALVAPKSAFEDWAIPGAPSGHVPVELEYFEALVDDVEKRFNIDRTKLMATGFSAGGMMTWNLACDRGDLFAAYAPVAGTFWEPTPKQCKSDPVSIIHTHGTTDRIVPITGRPIGPTKQGNLNNVLAMYKDHGTYENEKRFSDEDLSLDCIETSNQNAQILEYCTHPGGHSIKTAYIIRAWNKFVDLGIIK